MFSALIYTFISGAFDFFRENAATGRNVSISDTTVKSPVKIKAPKTEYSTEEAIGNRGSRTNAWLFTIFCHMFLTWYKFSLPHLKAWSVHIPPFSTSGFHGIFYM